MTRFIIRFSALAFLLMSAVTSGNEFHFDGSISPQVLRNYLSRAVTSLDLLTGKGDLDDNIRLLKSTGAKFAGRAIYVWGREEELPAKLEMARRNAAKIHAADPDIILQACIFEAVSKNVDRLVIPTWAFEALGQPIQQRNFRYNDMVYVNHRGNNQWGRDRSVPDVSRLETRLWFYYLGASYIDAGAEAIHFGQIEIMNGNDPNLEHCREILTLIRAYASAHARRHMVLCDAHVPSGGLAHDGKLLFDFHSFPMRVVEQVSHPQEGELKMGVVDSIYGRSKGGVTPSGWRCEHLPYLVELDNWGASDHPGKALGGGWIWGYDEIGWFAHQNDAYRRTWLKYAWKWVRTHDADGYVQMPVSRFLAAPVNGKGWYFANAPSQAAPGGFGDEETIKEIWADQASR